MATTIPTTGSTIDWGDVDTCASVANSVAAAVLAVISARQAQVTIQVANRLSYFSALRAWADEVATAIETAIAVCGELDPAKAQNPGVFERRFDLLCKVSAL